MTDKPLDPTLRRYLAAYRDLEPARARDPFTDPRLAMIAAERARRVPAPWYRRLALAPAPVFAGATLALVLALAPAGLPGAERTTEVTPLVSSTLDAAGAPTTDPLPLTDRPTPVAVDAPRILLVGLAGALTLLGLQRLRRRS